MERKAGQEKTVLDELIENPKSFSFIQAFRLLKLILKDENKIKVRPELSLSFPTTDISSIQKDGDKYIITATFLGLYGSSSPLPTFYTEFLLKEKREDISITRDFIDIFNSLLYPLLFKMWAKYNLAYRIVEQKDEHTTDLVSSFGGLKNRNTRKKYKGLKFILRYLGLFTQFPRSAQLLKSLLESVFGIKVEIEQCVRGWTYIPSHQRCLLGKNSNVIGVDSYLGEKIEEASSRFAVVIEVSNAKRFIEFLPNREKLKELKEIISVFLDNPLNWNLIFRLKTEMVKPACLGDENWGYLGWSSFLINESHKGDTVEISFQN